MELDIIYWLQSLRSGFLDGFFMLFSDFAYSACFSLVLVWLYLFYRKHLYAFFAVTYGAAIGANFLLKLVFRRMRPWMADSNVVAIFERNSDFSFPSGHSASIAVVACFVTFCVCKLVKTKGRRLGAYLGIWIATALCAISRVYLGQHYPSDIVGGICVGIIFSIIGISFYNKFLKTMARTGIAPLNK